MGNNKWNLNKSQRMQLKAWICCLGLLLLLILLLGQLFFALFEQEEKPDEEVHIPVIELLTNVWIMETDESGILIFRDGQEERYSYGMISGMDNGQSDGSVVPDEKSDDETKISYMYIPPESIREQIADITLTDGAVTDIQIKTEKINGKILSADDAFVEVEGYGKIPLASDYRGYRIYKELTMCTAKDLPIGYNFADLVVKDGKVCGILIVKEESMEYIRVLLKGADYEGMLHNEVILSSDSDFTVTYGSYDNPIQEQYLAGDELIISADSELFVGERILITPNVLTGKTFLKSVNRSQGVPGYRGHIELLRTEEGIAVINEVLLEEYLYCVVPSEMPASYPDEALKAQAICARTYAYGHMLQAGYPQYGAHVDDSTSYQVYNNILEQEGTTTAVKETYGQLLFTNAGGLAGTYYYSTSCGVGSDANVWKTEAAKTIDYLSAKSLSQSAMQAVMSGQSESLGDSLCDNESFEEFITAKNADDFEVSEGWYRWTYQVKKLDAERICGILQKRYETNEKLVLTLEDGEYISKPIEEFNEIQDMFISKRGAGGVADELIIVTEDENYKVISEHNIRYVLNNGESKVLRQDGSEVEMPTLLPSAFFSMSVVREKENMVGYILYGGGFGHGVGMSQNGARQMANCGYAAENILLFFYDNCSVRDVYEQ